MSHEIVDGKTAVVKAGHYLPYLFNSRNTISDRIAGTRDVFLLSNSSDIFHLSAFNYQRELSSTKVRLFQYQSPVEKKDWELHIEMSPNGSFKEKHIHMVYSGEPGKKSDCLSVNLSPLGKFFTLDFVSGMFEINIDRGKHKKTVLSQIKLLNPSDISSDKFNQIVESDQEGDEVIFRDFEYNRDSGMLGFKIGGFPYPRHTEEIVIPARIEAKLK